MNRYLTFYFQRRVEETIMNDDERMECEYENLIEQFSRSNLYNQPLILPDIPTQVYIALI